MAYTTIERHTAPGWTTARALLILAAGVLFGLMIAQVEVGGNLHDAVTVAPIAGEDWHGNVRRSAP